MGGKRAPLKPAPRGYTQEMAFKIIDMLMVGKTFRYISTRPGMPGETTIYRWMAQYPDFKEAVENARQLSAMSMEDKALEVADDLLNPDRVWSNNQLRARELALKQWGWSAERRDPGRFGARMAPSTVVPIQINTNIDLGQEGAAKQSLDVYAAHAKIAAGEPIDTAHEDVAQSPRRLDLRPPAPEKVKPGHKTKLGVTRTLSARGVKSGSSE